MDLHALLIRQAIGPVWARWERSAYLAHYRELVKRQFDDPSAIRARQWRAAADILSHAAKTVPYYRDRFAAEGIDAANIVYDRDFQRVPLLQKSDIRAAGDRLLSSDYRKEDLHVKETSGSTGVALEIRIDDASRQWKRACTLRSDEWSGWRFGERIAALWGNPDYLKHGWRGRFRNAVLERIDFINTLDLDEKGLGEFAKRLGRRPPTLLFGHAHSVYLFAEFLGSRGGSTFRPRGIITTAMVLHDWERGRIEEVFECPVTNRYGCEEVSLIACECERRNGLHVNADGVLVEVLRDGRPARPGESGSVVVTDLTNRAMPIIRYQIGDVAVPSARICPCGRGLPLLESLGGREADYVVTAAGKLLSGISLTDNFATKVPGASQVQIIQESLNHFRFRIVRAGDFGPDSLARLRQMVDEFFGPGVSFECEYPERIAPESSGKYRFCISRVPNPFVTTREATIV